VTGLGSALGSLWAPEFFPCACCVKGAEVLDMIAVTNVQAFRAAPA